MVVADLDGTLTHIPGNKSPLVTLWEELLCEYPGIEPKEVPKRINDVSLLAIINTLQKNAVRRDSVQKIACKFLLRQGMRKFFRVIKETNGLLVILTVNPFGVDWVRSFLPGSMPDHCIVATTPVWQNDVLAGFKNIITPRTKTVPPSLLGVPGREVILIGDALNDIRMIDGLNNEENPLVTAVGFCRKEERRKFIKAGFDTLLPVDSPMCAIAEFIKLRYL